MFLIGKMLTMAMLPTAFLVEAILIGLIFHRRRSGRFLTGAAALGLAICLVFPVDQWAVRPLDDRFPQVKTFPDHVDGIIVLGGSIDDVTSEDRQTPVTGAAGDRLTAFATLARHYPDAKLVFTGGSGDIVQGVTNEAKWVRVLFDGLGLPPDRVIYESRSRTTRENATDSFDLVHPGPDETWILVTSASHMPRSVGVFRRAGWNVLPWPVGYLSRDRLSGYSLSLGARMAVLDWAAHEWIGMAAYRARGWTDTLFPGPMPLRHAQDH
ncbi:YdcF family protein [Acetobacter fallax]|uniref:YdcF family protein n=1 Tax=Acetobacter fallax TaxID=1737473 RepID=A0ABX0KAZ5_9PROT|nr:YdcF family protein [Acetobacter fallax]NHO33574.1 YdcF family protein [Acetobacter fallax]NHO37180.1 YdcF family protein [Acetobacter fallax]